MMVYSIDNNGNKVFSKFCVSDERNDLDVNVNYNFLGAKIKWINIKRVLGVVLSTWDSDTQFISEIEIVPDKLVTMLILENFG